MKEENNIIHIKKSIIFIIIILIIFNISMIISVNESSNIRNDIENNNISMQNSIDHMIFNTSTKKQIIDLIIYNTSISLSTLNQMKIESFNNQDKYGLTEKYHKGQIEPMIYWEKVLSFYDDEYDYFLKNTNDSLKEIGKLKIKSNKIDRWVFIFSILLYIINTFLTILLSKKIDKYYSLNIKKHE